MRIDTIQELALATGLTCGAIRRWANLAGGNADYNPDHVDLEIHEKAGTSGRDDRAPEDALEALGCGRKLMAHLTDSDEICPACDMHAVNCRCDPEVWE